ncbi:hypothetical protein NA56DRAFT_452885 [Hyaloscypha hepaticicola]|uniref:C2H2-type domain-containing protein n=1 Tax=Hyaloscypha hepaticicola TaxID=2082293 RepID=A0A2J6PFT5_9HELO|nr:hypothetical protein NA56DRAFT_452885 [Hyaloscypha hepaticicola]
MQPLAFHGIDPLFFNGPVSAPWDFPSRDLNGVATSAAIAPGFPSHPVQNVWDQPLVRSDAATGSLLSRHFDTTQTSIGIDLSALGPDSASASGLQSYGSQNVWDQTPSQNDAAAGLSWGQSMIGPSSNGAFRPFNVDGGVIDAGVGSPMPWPTNEKGDFQEGVGSNVVAPLTQWDDGNIFWQPVLTTASLSQQNPGPNQPLPANLPGPQLLAPALAATNAASPTLRFQCTMCTRAFKRDFERTRHEASVHGINRRLHLCSVPGCPKSHGTGFSRTDKVTEHLWRKHANLGYTGAA